MNQYIFFTFYSTSNNGKNRPKIHPHTHTFINLQTVQCRLYLEYTFRLEYNLIFFNGAMTDQKKMTNFLLIFLFCCCCCSGLDTHLYNKISPNNSVTDDDDDDDNNECENKEKNENFFNRNTYNALNNNNNNKNLIIIN